jgi:hypothetical protein
MLDSISVLYYHVCMVTELSFAATMEGTSMTIFFAAAAILEVAYVGYRLYKASVNYCPRVRDLPSSILRS